MNMKRLLLSLICCSPLLFSPSVSLSIDLTGPSGETRALFEQYGPVSPAETLWAISSKLRPDKSVSVQQTLVAIYKLNPFAFYKGNINQIIPESIIKVPSFEFVAQQNDKEAMDLIRKYSLKKNNVIKKEILKIPEKVAEKTIEVPSVEPEPVKIIDPAIVAENEANKEKLIVADNKLSELQAEMQLLNEQFIVATEATQVLKLKLQPLSDEIRTLSDQLAEEAVIQDKLQKIIDDYRVQLDAIEESPFSGDGIINETLRLITSSMTNLLTVIISPLILLLLIFVVISRIRSKRLLAAQEQELAEVSLMEESGQFDELLTENLSDNDEKELDITADSAINEPESINIDELTIPDELEEIDLNDDQTPDVVDLTDDDEFITSEDDPFGIGALTDEEELISSIDLDDDELETSDDDPFGIGALTESDEEISSINLDEDEPETSEDDPFGISALANDEALISSTDLEKDSVISEAEQADLDLAAEWEAQISAEPDDDSANSIDVEELSESDIDLTEIATEDELGNEENTQETLTNDELSELDSLEAINDDGVSKIVDEIETDILDISELDVQEGEPSLNIDTAEAINENEAGVFDLSELDSSDKIPSLDTDALEISDENEADVFDPSELDSSDEIPSLDTDALEMPDENEADVFDLSELDSSDEIPSLDTDALEIPDENEADVFDLSELDSSDEIPSLDTDALEIPDESEANVSDLSELDSSDEIPSLDIDAPEIPDESEANVIDLSELDSSDEIPSLDVDTLDIQENSSSLENDVAEVLEESETDGIKARGDQDPLVHQLTDVAFNELVPLPKVDSARQNDFIDIETLLENSDVNDKDEPYSELELDLGLEEFPDVVNLQESIDIDDDENGIGAQLDLARAYLEIDDQAGAKEILMSVVEDSSGKQRAEIDKLLSRLK
jgi:pilus assembly protein FimV